MRVEWHRWPDEKPLDRDKFRWLYCAFGPEEDHKGIMALGYVQDYIPFPAGDMKLSYWAEVPIPENGPYGNLIRAA